MPALPEVQGLNLLWFVAVEQVVETIDALIAEADVAAHNQPPKSSTTVRTGGAMAMSAANAAEHMLNQ